MYIPQALHSLRNIWKYINLNSLPLGPSLVDLPAMLESKWHGSLSETDPKSLDHWHSLEVSC